MVWDEDDEDADEGADALEDHTLLLLPPRSTRSRSAKGGPV